MEGLPANARAMAEAFGLSEPEEDIFHLKEKISLGASELITQLFFQNDHLYRFIEKADINALIEEILK